jgi:hypothetical protein
MKALLNNLKEISNYNLKNEKIIIKKKVIDTIYDPILKELPPKSDRKITVFLNGSFFFEFKNASHLSKHSGLNQKNIHSIISSNLPVMGYFKFYYKYN